MATDMFIWGEVEMKIFLDEKMRLVKKSLLF